MMIINYAFLLLFGFHWIPFGDGESSDSNSDGIKLPRAIGGKMARPGQFPYVVSLQKYIQSTAEYIPICGGSLITTRTVLTAAHCVFSKDYEWESIKSYLGVLGTVDVMNRTNNVTFKRSCRHLEYRASMGWKDIAVLHTSEPVKLGDTIKTIPLIGAGLSVVGMRGTTLGWGKTDYHHEEGSRMLQYADVDITSYKVCNDYYDQFLNYDEMCYGTEGTGICDGDSGGPLVVLLHNVEVQVGIAVDTDVNCTGLPTIGTNISSLNTWIRKTVKGTPVFIS